MQVDVKPDIALPDSSWLTGHLQVNFWFADYPLAERTGMRRGFICYRTFPVTAQLAMPCEMTWSRARN